MAPLVRAAQFINTCRYTGVLNLTNFIKYANTNSSKRAAYANFSVLKNQSKLMFLPFYMFICIFELKLIFLFRNKNYGEEIFFQHRETLSNSIRINFFLQQRFKRRSPKIFCPVPNPHHNKKEYEIVLGRAYFMNSELDIFLEVLDEFWVQTLTGSNLFKL